LRGIKESGKKGGLPAVKVVGNEEEKKNDGSPLNRGPGKRDLKKGGASDRE